MKILILLAMITFTPTSFADELRIVSVRGEGEIKVKPDLARIELQVRTLAKDAKTAQEKNAAEMTRVQKVLSSDFSIASKDIQTSGYQLNPEYRYENNGKQVFLGYRAFHSLSVTYRNLDKVGALLDKIVGKGTEEVGVNLNGVSFDSDKRKEHELLALEAAMKNAQSRAEALAKFAKRGLKGVRRISDSNVSYQPYRPVMAGKAKLMNAEMMSDAGTTVATGEITVDSNVAVDYDLE